MYVVLRKIGFVVLVLLISTAIFLVITNDREVKEDVLEYTLGMMGKKLFAMVPDGPEKEAIKEQYDQLVQQAVQKEVTPDQIESVAASIFNATAVDTVLSPEQAEAIISITISEPEKKLPYGGKWIEVPPEPPECESSPKAYPKAVLISQCPETWDSLTVRISSMYRFNERLHKVLEENRQQLRDMPYRMQFRSKRGLRLALDAELKEKIQHQREYRHLAKELHQLEKEAMLEWREDFRAEIREQMQQLREELKTLDELKELKQAKHLQRLKALKALESLKHLKYLEQINPVDGDSIRKIVEKSLKEAGVQPE
ncbi:hypothetical protein JXJ21_26510 [candidate division KSB1 bacterium]|nr:hypothetical protein [candidate division KSB1 bacterium]